MAVFAAEALPAGRSVTGLILLSASISNGYNLTEALGHTQKGIVNFYNKDDIPLLGIGTTVMGNVDGIHGPSAGLTGFYTPTDRDREEKRLAYSKLYQIELDNSVAGDQDAHTASTSTNFVSSFVAPWVNSPSWPANRIYASAK